MERDPVAKGAHIWQRKKEMMKEFHNDAEIR